MNLERNHTDIKKYSRRKVLGIAASGLTAMAINSACGSEKTEKTIVENKPTIEPTEVIQHSEAISRLVKDLIPIRVSVPSIYLQNISVGEAPIDDEKDPPAPVVPNHGVVTPGPRILSMENKVWIMGHSSWQGVPQDMFSLQNINIGDEVILDVQDRESREPYNNVRFTIQDLVVTDISGGGKLLNNGEEAPIFPYLMMQTSVRENGEGKKWILDRDLLMSKARIFIEGSIDDPSKYLLLFANGLIRYDQLSRLQG